MVHTKTDSIKTDDPWNVINNLFGNSKDKWYSTLVGFLGVTYTIRDMNHNLIAYITETEKNDPLFYNPEADTKTFKKRKFKNY